MNQSELEANTCDRRKERGKVCDQIMFGFGRAFNLLRKWREFFKPITERSKAKPIKCKITFYTQLKSAQRGREINTFCTTNAIQAPVVQRADNSTQQIKWIGLSRERFQRAKSYFLVSGRARNRASTDRPISRWKRLLRRLAILVPRAAFLLASATEQRLWP